MNSQINFNQMNPMLNQFNQYHAMHPENVPFQGNNLMRSNPMVMNQMHLQQQQLMMQRQQMMQQQMMQQQIMQQRMMQQQQRQMPRQRIENMASQAEKIREVQQQNMLQTMLSRFKGRKGANIIEEILAPTDIESLKGDGKEVESNHDIINNYRKTYQYQIDNTPYKNIFTDFITKIKDPRKKKYAKGVDYKQKIKRGDVRKLIVHLINEDDRSVDEMMKEFEELVELFDNMDFEFELEYSTDNYDGHKKKYEEKHNYVQRLRHESKNHSGLKEDNIEFFKRIQEEHDAKMEKSDAILQALNEDKGDSDMIKLS
jgi:hypothetical protein